MEMRGARRHFINRLRIFCGAALLLSLQGRSQDTTQLYTIRNGNMYISLSKQLPIPQLDSFIVRYDLHLLGLKRFINSGKDDSIKLAGWKLGSNSNAVFTLSKPLLSFNDLNDPAQRIAFAGKDQHVNATFPSVSNSLLFGYNRFRNKSAFAINKSRVIFFLRNNTSAATVKLAGSFNSWDPESLPMKKVDSGWTAEVELTPGKYWYKFIIDGNWTTDTDNRLSENDGIGNTNSVFYVTNTVFRLNGYMNARRVYLAGSFNNWDSDQLLMEKTGSGWILPVYLADGTHRYRFIVDHKWMADPDNPLRFPNEYNEYNSVIKIGKSHRFSLSGYQNATRVNLYGSFNNWRDDELFMQKTSSGWELDYVLGPGNYEYKFVVDGKSIPDPENLPLTGKGDRGNSFLVLDPNYRFHLKGFLTASKVFLAGDFNNWSSNSIAMQRDNDGWSFTVHLSPGKHLYKLIVDGKWIIDPGNRLWEENQYGTGNSVLWIDK